jgi:hypothetical protein
MAGLALLVFGGIVVAGQQQRPAATLDDVANEIRALRADLRQNTRAATQMQLLTARLSLQEQRLAVLSNQRNDIVAKLTIESGMRAAAESRVKQLEELKTRSEPGVSRRELDDNEEAFRQQLSLHSGIERQLQTQESQLATEIASEQNRWQDFNNRLDDLEKSLTR